MCNITRNIGYDWWRNIGYRDSLHSIYSIYNLHGTLDKFLCATVTCKKLQSCHTQQLIKLSFNCQLSKLPPIGIQLSFTAKLPYALMHTHAVDTEWRISRGVTGAVWMRGQMILVWNTQQNNAIVTCTVKCSNHKAVSQTSKSTGKSKCVSPVLFARESTVFIPSEAMCSVRCTIGMWNCEPIVRKCTPWWPLLHSLQTGIVWSPFWITTITCWCIYIQYISLKATQLHWPCVTEGSHRK